MEAKIGTSQGRGASLSFSTQSDAHLRFAVTVDGTRREFSPNAYDFQASVLLVCPYPTQLIEGVHSA